jgi:hypothetical protein
MVRATIGHGDCRVRVPRCIAEDAIEDIAGVWPRGPGVEVELIVAVLP